MSYGKRIKEALFGYYRIAPKWALCFESLFIACYIVAGFTQRWWLLVAAMGCSFVLSMVVVVLYRHHLF